MSQWIKDIIAIVPAEVLCATAVAAARPAGRALYNVMPEPVKNIVDSEPVQSVIQSEAFNNALDGVVGALAAKSLHDVVSPKDSNSEDKQNLFCLLTNEQAASALGMGAMAGATVGATLRKPDQKHRSSPDATGETIFENRHPGRRMTGETHRTRTVYTTKGGTKTTTVDKASDKKFDESHLFTSFDKS